jgi:hypothetical protein
VDAVVDPEKVENVMDRAGARQVLSMNEPRAYACAAAFAVADEEVRLSILTAPEGGRGVDGPARWLVLTDTRSIEVSGEMHGDWWSRQSTSRPFASPITLTIRSLRDFRRLSFSGHAWIWLLDSGDSIRDFVGGTTAMLHPEDGSDPLILWANYRDSGSAFPPAATIVEAIRWLASRVPLEAPTP